MEQIGVWEKIKENADLNLINNPPQIFYSPFSFFSSKKASQSLSQFSKLNLFTKNQFGKSKSSNFFYSIAHSSLLESLHSQLNSNSFIYNSEIRSVESNSEKSIVCLITNQQQQDIRRIESDIVIDCEGMNSVERLSIDFLPKIIDSTKKIYFASTPFNNLIEDGYFNSLFFFFLTQNISPIKIF